MISKSDEFVRIFMTKNANYLQIPEALQLEDHILNCYFQNMVGDIGLNIKKRYFLATRHCARWSHTCFPLLLIRTSLRYD